jgi:hypothetical protein
MKTTFTKYTAKFGCYKENDNEQDHYLPNETFTIDDVLNAEVSLKDKAWFIRYNCGFTDKEFREFAIGCALCVLPIYESRYPDNKAPREAIEAAQAYLAGTIDIDELRLKRKAAAYAAVVAVAAVAYAAADVAAYAAADVVAYVAVAAVAAAAAADAAVAAADADAAAYVARNSTNYQDLLLQFFKDFTKCS